jgi:hypothetical protein
MPNILQKFPVTLTHVFSGRLVEEVQFDDSFKIGPFRAHDFFSDGSLYLLDVPGVIYTSHQISLRHC